MITVKNLSCGYGSIRILDNVSFEVKKGEHLGVIGPNGSGKTTLLKAITKLIKLESGAVIIDGKDAKKWGVKELSRKLAVVSQNTHDGHLTVEELVLLGRIPYYKRFQFIESQKDIDISNHCMEMTGTLKFKDRNMSELSGGERQLVSIARALAQEPEIILLDEPLTHLDISHQVRVLDIVKTLITQKGLTSITVMHDLNLASEYCDRLLLLNNGRVCRIGLPSEVLTYQAIEEVYKTVVIVKENPLSKKPYVFVVPNV
jgi:iron complex transport system ATP-binding protein